MRAPLPFPRASASMTGNPKIKAQYGAFDGTGDAASPNRFASRLSDVADLRWRRSLRALIQGKHS